MMAEDDKINWWICSLNFVPILFEKCLLFLVIYKEVRLSWQLLPLPSASSILIIVRIFLYLYSNLKKSIYL